MPVPNRIRSLLAALMVALPPAAHAAEKVISGDYTLKNLSADLFSAAGPTLTVRIDNYANPGQLKIDQPPANVTTLQLQRFSTDSDGVIDVDSTFIDVKNFSGTLVLKGLAFRLKPKAVLIAGFDLNKPNRNLILDSCFIYAETLDASFLNWQGDAQSQIELKNSWFVAKTSSTNIASMQLGGNDVTFSYCLFNFPGMVTASPIYKSFQAFSNTFNRVQFNLGGTTLGGTDPYFAFTSNLAAFHGPVNALGGTDFYFLRASGFSPLRSTISYNRIYKTWKGFSSSGVDESKDVPSDTTYDGKKADELWDWYTDAKDPTTGMLAGNAQLRHYNTLPPTGRVDTALGGGLSVYFKPADFPRNFRLVQGPAPVLTDSAFRFREPFASRLAFGPFRVDSIRLNSPAENGKPVLLAQIDSAVFVRQPGTAYVGQSPSVFVNTAPSARGFVLVDSGNTPRGTNVDPELPGANAFEHLRFARVTVAGQTDPLVDDNTKMPPNLRYLGRLFGFNTTAVVDTSVTFASAFDANTLPWARSGAGSTAFYDSSVFWYWRAKDTLIPAIKGSPWDPNQVSGKVSYPGAPENFQVFLVEKLSLPAGAPYLKKFPGMQVESYSRTGYQLYADSLPVDSGAYGSATMGYKFAWSGRSATDSLFLILPKPAADAKVFVKVPTKPEPDTLKAVFDGTNFRIPIGMADSGKTFFAGVKFNVRAGVPFFGTVDSVAIDSLVSSTSGILRFGRLSETDAQSLGSNAGTVFRNTRYLAGRANRSAGLNLTARYNLAFAIGKHLADSSVEVWVLEGGTWKSLGILGHAVGDSIHALINAADHPAIDAIVAMQRFEDPATYVTPNPIANADTLIFSLAIKDTMNPLLGYCLEVRTIDSLGEVRDSGCEQRAPGDTVRIPIDHKLGYIYRVVYFTGTEAVPVELKGDYQYPAGFGWDAKKALAGDSAAAGIPQGQWRLFTVPVEASLAKILQAAAPIVGADTVVRKDTTLVLDLITESGTTRFDTLTSPKSARAGSLTALTMTPGRAYLAAASHPFNLTLDSLPPSLRTPKPETLAVKAGWNLIGNPYPIRLGLGCIRTKNSHRMWMLGLSRKSDATYFWDTVQTALDPFAGYAYYASAAETLYIDPANPGPSAPAKAAAGMARLRIGLAADFGSSSMALVRGGGAYPIRFLPAPGAGPELRVGGGAGFWMKPVGDMARIDEPVEIRSGRNGRAAFTVGESGDAPAFVLIETTTGRMYDAAAARALPLRAGSQSYRLIAGDPDFVAEQSLAFAVAAPGNVSLFQNYPNPVRGHTRIAFALPTTRDSDRDGYIEVLDTRGRRMARSPLSGMRVGRQSVDIDATAWTPGVYLYRLVIRDAGKTVRLQKRMLVLP